MSKSKLIVFLALVLTVLAITWAGIRERPPPPIEVQTSKARREPITRTVTGAGKIQAATTVKISSNLSGDLIELQVKVGDRVTKGQVLGRIDKRRFEASAKQALAAQSANRAEVQVVQVEAQRTQTEFDRVVGLLAKGLTSASDLDRARADRDAALARLSSARERLSQATAASEEAQTALSNTTLVSPIDGTVIELSREVGERVRGSDFSEDVVMTLASMAAMEVKIEVGEHEVVHLTLGQQAWVSVDAIEGQVFSGEVIEIAQKALVKAAGTEAEVTSFPIIVALKSRPPGVLSGMNAEVRIAAETKKQAVVVPIQAVTVRPKALLKEMAGAVESKSTPSIQAGPGEAFVKVVFVVQNDQRLTLRRVQTGISSDTDIEVIEGLKEGEQVVEGPYRTLAKDLKDGDFVEEMQQGKSRRRGGRPRS